MSKPSEKALKYFPRLQKGDPKEKNNYFFVQKEFKNLFNFSNFSEERILYRRDKNTKTKQI